MELTLTLAVIILAVVVFVLLAENVGLTQQVSDLMPDNDPDIHSEQARLDTAAFVDTYLEQRMPHTPARLRLLELEYIATINSDKLTLHDYADFGIIAHSTADAFDKRV